MRRFPRFQNLSMQAKMILASVATSLLSLMAALTLLIVLSWSSARTGVLERGASTADLLAMHLSTSVQAGDAQAAKDILKPLAQFENILSIVVTNADGEMFVEHGAHADFKQQMAEGKTGFYGRNLIIRAPVFAGSELVGEIHVVSFPRIFHNAIRNLVYFITGVLIISSCLAFAVSRRLSRRIIQPVSSLTKAMEHVRESGDLSKRITIESCDELGRLTARYNELLDRISEKETGLQRALDELVDARDVAEAANVAKSQFLANMSHELRTPLNAVIGYSSLLKVTFDERGEAETVSDLERVLGAGQHLLGMINELLDLSKIETGKLELDIRNVVVGSVIQETLAALGPAAEKNHNRLVTPEAFDINFICADQMRLRQCLLNLLSNACKFTQNGVVELTIARREINGKSHIAFEVSDTGIGMSPDQISALFNPFVQADSTDTRQFGGTGLGLTISRHLARMMGGDIFVDSELGKGSAFTLCLPEKQQMTLSVGEKAA